MSFESSVVSALRPTVIAAEQPAVLDPNPVALFTTSCSSHDNTLINPHSKSDIPVRPAEWSADASSQRLPDRSPVLAAFCPTLVAPHEPSLQPAHWIAHRFTDWFAIWHPDEPNRLALFRPLRPAEQCADHFPDSAADSPPIRPANLRSVHLPFHPANFDAFVTANFASLCLSHCSAQHAPLGTAIRPPQLIAIRTTVLAPVYCTLRPSLHPALGSAVCPANFSPLWTTFLASLYSTVLIPLNGSVGPPLLPSLGSTVRPPDLTSHRTTVCFSFDCSVSPPIRAAVYWSDLAAFLSTNDYPFLHPLCPSVGSAIVPPHQSTIRPPNSSPDLPTHRTPHISALGET